MAELVKASRSQTETLNNVRDDILFQPDPAMLEEHSENETEGDLNLNTAVNALLDPSSESTATEGERNAENKRRPIPAPDNCKHLTSVLANEEIWDLMARKTKTVDLAFQKVQEQLDQGLSALTILADQLLKDIQNSKTTDTAAVFDGIALVGSANWNITMKRRELIKPDLSPPYTRLCKENIKPSTKLFGDDLSKHVKELAAARKAGQQMQKGVTPARIVKQKGYRPKPYDRPQTSFSQTLQPGNKRIYKRPF